MDWYWYPLVILLLVGAAVVKLLLLVASAAFWWMCLKWFLRQPGVYQPVYAFSRQAAAQARNASSAPPAGRRGYRTAVLEGPFHLPMPMPHGPLALEALARKWSAIATSTAPVDPQRLVPAIHALYAAVGMKPPRVVVAPSPLAMILGHCLASVACKGAGSPAQAGQQERPAGAASATLREVVPRELLAIPREGSAQADAMVGRAMTAQHTAIDAAIVATMEGLQAQQHAARHARWGATWQAAVAAAYQAIGREVPVAAPAIGGPASRAWAMFMFGLHAGVEQDALARSVRDWRRDYERYGQALWDDYYLTSVRDVYEVPLPHNEPYRAWEPCTVQGACRMMHEAFCIVSDRPLVLNRDPEGRLHCEDGPSVRWRDGWCLYHWHGVRIPEDREYIIHSPHLISVAGIEAEANEEIRRWMIDRYGLAKYLADCGARVVHELPPDHEVTGLRSARLLRSDPARGEPVIFIELLNSTPEPDGTSKRYLLRVDPRAYDGEAARNCHAAAASTWRRADGSLAYPRYTDYRPNAES